MIKFILPFPPTVNSRYVQGKGKRSHGGAVNKWKEKAIDALNMQNVLPVGGRAVLEYSLDTPDNRCRDAANYEKFVTDLLVSQNILQDDSARYIQGILIYWNDTPGNKITVTINEFKKAE